jgi:hypothetical protein
MKTTLDSVQTSLWNLHADLIDNNVQKNEVEERVKMIANNLEEIIALHDLWEKGLPENISGELASWYTGTVYCRVKHPKYGGHKVTPRQIKYSTGKYKSELFRDMIAQAIRYSVNMDNDSLRNKILEDMGATCSSD